MLYLVTGPPAAGKTTWVQSHAKPGDITIDYDSIAETLGGCDHDYPTHIKTVTHAARQAAIDAAIPMARTHDVYIIHTRPSPQLINRYRRLGAQVITIDPGRETVLARCREQRPPQVQGAARRWYDQPQQTPARPANPSRRPPAAALAFFGPET